MKKGQIIAVIVTAAIVVVVYFAARTPKVSDVAETNPAETEVEEVVTTTNPLDAKVEEAVAIIKSGNGQPMAAIQLLREVIAADSNHIGANYWLGEFSVMSGQHEKAIPRYAKILRLQPDNTEACIKLAEAYHANGQTTEAKDVLTAFLESHPDEKTKEQIMPVLEKLSL